jgi:hypothetical protein
VQHEPPRRRFHPRPLPQVLAVPHRTPRPPPQPEQRIKHHMGEPLTITARTVLASIEAIPETPENFRQIREAIRDAQKLVAAEAGK